MQAYSDPSKEHDEHSLPDLEIFYRDEGNGSLKDAMDKGFYYWFCLPGCLPDSEPTGPFKAQAEALADARFDSSDIDY